MPENAFKLIVLISAILLSTFSSASDEAFLPVEQAFPYTFEYDENTLQLQWQIADHYYLYLDRLTLKQDGKIIALNFAQSPIEKEDEYFGKVQIFKHVLNASADPSDVNSNKPLNLSFQGCAEAGLCYPPVKAQLIPPGDKVEFKKTSLISSADKGEPKAPAELLVAQLCLSASNSVSVGKRKPFGHGLLVPLSPCHSVLS